jgi:hypothetical protein
LAPGNVPREVLRPAVPDTSRHPQGCENDERHGGSGGFDHSTLTGAFREVTPPPVRVTIDLEGVAVMEGKQWNRS